MSRSILPLCFYLMNDSALLTCYSVMARAMGGVSGVEWSGGEFNGLG